MAYLGIDLGTTNSVAVLYHENTDTLETIKIDQMEEVLPSVVTFLPDEILVGSEAKNSALIYPTQTITSIKRHMGEDMTITIEDQKYSPVRVSSEILKALKKAAEDQAGMSFDEVVITHPAYFNDRQIYDTKEAGLMAGFKSVNLLSEPLASAIEYGYKQGYAQTLLVYDLGGGTFDACVLKVTKDLQGNEVFRELSDVGDMNLGGDDFDQMLVDYMAEQFRIMNDVALWDLEKEEKDRAYHRLRQEAESLKRKLSATNKVAVKIAPLIIYEDIPLNLSLEVTKEDFEGLIRPYIDRSREIVATALSRAQLEPDDVSKVILVGGSTLVPMVKRMVAGFIKEPYRATDPAKSVAMGAAIYNFLMHLPQAQVKVGQIARQHIGTEAIVDETTGKKALIPVIPMGTAIPASITETGFKASANSSALRVDVFQWEEDKEAARKYIGSLLLEGVTKDHEISITYSINQDNLFEATVTDMTSGKTITEALDRTKTMPDILPSTVSDHEGAGINVDFIIDTTGSMDRYIDGVKERAMAFSKIIADRGIAYQLGLIGFGDLGEREKPKVYKWTTDVAKFQKRVKKIPRTCGGDIPESALDALETGMAHLEKGADPSFKNIMILITDAPPHIPTVSGLGVAELVEQLKAKGVLVYVVAMKDRKSLEAYEPLTALGGRYYSMDEDFNDILDHIAYDIASLVRVK